MIFYAQKSFLKFFERGRIVLDLGGSCGALRKVPKDNRYNYLDFDFYFFS